MKTILNLLKELGEKEELEESKHIKFNKDNMIKFLLGTKGAGTIDKINKTTAFIKLAIFDPELPWQEINMQIEKPKEEMLKLILNLTEMHESLIEETIELIKKIENDDELKWKKDI